MSENWIPTKIQYLQNFNPPSHHPSNPFTPHSTSPLTNLIHFQLQTLLLLLLVSRLSTPSTNLSISSPCCCGGRRKRALAAAAARGALGNAALVPRVTDPSPSRSARCANCEGQQNCGGGSTNCQDCKTDVAKCTPQQQKQCRKCTPEEEKECMKVGECGGLKGEGLKDEGWS